MQWKTSELLYAKQYSHQVSCFFPSHVKLFFMVLFNVQRGLDPEQERAKSYIKKNCISNV